MGGEPEGVSAKFLEKKRELMALYEQLTKDLRKPVNHAGKPDIE